MIIAWALSLITALISLNHASFANDLYVYQVGDDFTLTVTQDGENHGISGIPGATKGIEGDGNTVIIHQDGGQHSHVYGMIDGDNNIIDVYQGGTGESNDATISITGDTNTVDINQGMYETGITDSIEGGNHQAEAIIVGNSNNVETYQADQATNCCSDAHDLSVTLTGNNNDVYHVQRGAKHIGDIDVTGNSNDIDLMQRGSEGHAADIDISGDGHTVNSLQQDNANHSLTLDLSNGGGAYSITTTQENTTSRSYTLSGTCATTAGCAVTVTQN